MPEKKQYKEKPLSVTARDVGAGMGKLPPQAIDIEESILGILLVDHKSILKIKELLKPDHFYKESHNKIYKAICDLDSNGKTPDAINVTNIIKKQGELESVGGPFYITTLLSKATTSANIEYHAKIVIEKFIQREIIRIGSTAVRNGFEDTADVLKLLEQTRSNLDTLGENGSSGTIFITDDMVANPNRVILKLKERSVLSEGNLSIIISGPGTGKSQGCEAVASLFADPDCDGLGFTIEWNPTTHPDGVLYIDTERSKDDSINGMCRIKDRINYYNRPELRDPVRKMPKGITFVNFRGHETVDACKTALEVLIRKNKFRLILVDGVTDFVNDPLDLKEISIFLKWLSAKASQMGIGVLTTIHNNPKGDQESGRGHAGSELHRKGESQILLANDKDDPSKKYFTMDFKAAKNRNGKDSDLRHYFEWSEELHRFVSIDYVPKEPAKKTAVDEDIQIAMKKIFENRSVISGEALSKFYQELRGVGRSTSFSHIAKAVENKVINKDKSDYTLNIEVPF